MSGIRLINRLVPGALPRNGRRSSAGARQHNRREGVKRARQTVLRRRRRPLSVRTRGSVLPRQRSAGKA